MTTRMDNSIRATCRSSHIPEARLTKLTPGQFGLWTGSAGFARPKHEEHVPRTVRNRTPSLSPPNIETRGLLHPHLRPLQVSHHPITSNPPRAASSRNCMLRFAGPPSVVVSLRILGPWEFAGHASSQTFTSHPYARNFEHKNIPETTTEKPQAPPRPRAGSPHLQSPYPCNPLLGTSPCHGGNTRRGGRGGAVGLGVSSGFVD